MIKKLPNWAVLDSRYDFDDVESNTAVEQTARLYKAIQDLINDWNIFEDKIKTDFSSYKSTVNQEIQCFEEKLTKIMHDYIMKIDEKIKMQDLVIDNAVKYMKDNLSSSINSLLTEMRELGEFDEAVLTAFDNVNIKLAELENSKPYYVYDEKTETITFYNMIKESE